MSPISHTEQTRPAGHQVTHPSARPLTERGFTLVELLLSMTILSVLMLVVVNVIGIVQQQWVRSNSRVSAFREARMAFDLMARNLSQATLNTYWANEVDPLGMDAAGQQRTKAKNYVRQSELQFVSGRTSNLLVAAAGNVNSYPGHAIFFQAPLGVTRLVSATGTAVDTESMVNLLCGRGYFVSWGDDQPFRPAFLPSTVKPRFRYRLMEYSPTAESNRIYYDPLNASDLASRRPITNPGRSRAWFQDAITSTAAATDTTGSWGFTRPVADNIIALVISPQLEQSASDNNPERIAPLYEYDSVFGPVPPPGHPDAPEKLSNPGAPSPAAGSQGTQHILPPLVKLTMVALDSAAGEKLAEGGNEAQQQRLAAALAPLFTSASQYNSPTSAFRADMAALEAFLVSEKLNFRLFTTTIALKQARWSR